jgi:hypothetical protein
MNVNATRQASSNSKTKEKKRKGQKWVQKWLHGATVATIAQVHSLEPQLAA